jgi:hypothetical protein
MREIHDHKSFLQDDMDVVSVFATDEPGPGDACHDYMISFDGGKTERQTRIYFQKGPIKENTFNGVNNESIIAVVIDRLKGFQSGHFSCNENAVALRKLEEAIMWLQRRTRNRIQRGVEGLNKV